MAIEVDKYTKEQATEYANAEADRIGFEIGSERWKKVFKEYLSFATSTMSVGRNPRGKNHYAILKEIYPQVFGENGFAGRMSRQYVDQTGSKITTEQAGDRVLSSVHNLMKLFENGGLGIKNTTKGNKPGKIPNSEMSELQFPDKKGFATEDEYFAAIQDVIFNWLVRDLVTNCILESLDMFFRLTPDDVAEIMSGVNMTVDSKDVTKFMGQGRAQFVKELSARVHPKVALLNYKKMVTG